MITKVFDTSGFPARWECGQWTALHGWTHIISDSLIFCAYAAIPIALAYYVSKREDAPFPAVMWLFAAFILSCGIGHLIEATIFWHPWYRLSGVVKAITATVSWATVIALVPAIPQALHFPGMAKVNEELRREVEERKQVEQDLEARVQELGEANGKMRRLYEASVGREERMIELKERVNALLKELGREPEFEVRRT